MGEKCLIPATRTRALIILDDRGEVVEVEKEEVGVKELRRKQKVVERTRRTKAAARSSSGSGSSRR